MSTARSRPTAIDPSVKARLLRDAAASAPLWIEAHGSSMGHTVPSGASVLLVQPATPRRGQVWGYCDQSGSVVVHRYRRRTGVGHVLQGDTCVHADAPVGDEQLIGRVAALRHRGRVRSVGWGNWCLGECQRVPRLAVARASRVWRRMRRGR